MVRVEGIGLRWVWLVRGLSGSGFFFFRTGRVRWFGPTGRDQVHVPQGEPTFRKGGGAQGRGKSAGVSGAGVRRVRFEEGVQGGGVDSVGQGGWRNRCLLVQFSHRGTRLSVL